jgi:hypothetical protein
MRIFLPLSHTILSLSAFHPSFKPFQNLWTSSFRYQPKNNFFFTNFDQTNDDHGDHDNLNLRHRLNHLSKQKEFGVLFGYF